MSRSVEIIDFGVVEYSRAWDAQVGYFDGLLSGKSGPKETRAQNMDGSCGVVMLCEHPHVYTMGKSGSVNNLLVDGDFLSSIGATYFKTDRGGDITYHGFGQLVGYPILDLELLGLSLKQYIELMEQAVIDTVAQWGVVAGRLDGATGVWIEGQRKICAIGVKASRYVTMHGFALNVNTDLKYFSYINPCGFVDKGVTSLEKELGQKVDMEQVKRAFADNFARALGVTANRD